ncbi:hypothetical protein [Tsukamurella soli]
MTNDSGRAGRPTAERAIRIAMRADKVGSDWYIGGGFLIAPTLWALGRWWPASLPAAIAVIVVAAILLAALGVVMACGLSVLAIRGARLDAEWWDSILPGAGAALTRVPSEPCRSSDSGPGGPRST